MVSLVGGSKAGDADLAKDFIVVDEISTGSNFLTVVVKEKYKDAIVDIRSGALTLGKWYVVKNKSA